MVVGFINPIQHPVWLLILYLLRRKWLFLCCIDFHDLNKTCPKDEFPLRNIDNLLDATTGHSMFSFVDGLVAISKSKCTHWMGKVLLSGHLYAISLHCHAVRTTK